MANETPLPTASDARLRYFQLLQYLDKSPRWGFEGVSNTMLVYSDLESKARWPDNTRWLELFGLLSDNGLKEDIEYYMDYFGIADASDLDVTPTACPHPAVGIAGVCCACDEDPESESLSVYRLIVAFVQQYEAANAARKITMWAKNKSLAGDELNQVLFFMLLASAAKGKRVALNIMDKKIGAISKHVSNGENTNASMFDKEWAKIKGAESGADSGEAVQDDQ